MESKSQFVLSVLFFLSGFAVVLPAQTVRINEFSAHSMFVSESGDLPVDDWRVSDFDDADWAESVLPLGMDRSADYTLPVNLVTQMYGLTSTVYGRSKIVLSEAMVNSGESVTLSMDYDDGFILYINGNEVARGNVSGSGESPFDGTADEAHRASNDNGDGVDHTEEFDLGKASLLFKTGTNTLAVHLLNNSLSSSDAYVNLSIRIGGSVITNPDSVWKYFVGISKPDDTVTVAGLDSDWIELYNPTDVDIYLEDWSLTDDSGNINKWKFPAVSIAAKGYLLVFASGEEQNDPSQMLQAPFKLSSSGEYLGLYDSTGNLVSGFSPEYPEQPDKTSFGWDETAAAYKILVNVTPGRINGEASYLGVVGDTAFSVDRGFYDEPIALEITSKTEGAIVIYTTDGSLPTESNGEIYNGPIQISTTTVIRAYAHKEELLPTNVDTHSYIFLNDVIVQENNPEGYPETWKSNPGKPDLPPDYEMDPEVTGDPLYADKMRAALLSIPTISLVTEVEHFFNRNTGIYMNPQETGQLWERPVSVELIYPNGQKGFQLDAGIRIQGGHTRNPERSPKRSFRLAFRKEYGSSNLEFPLFPEPDAAEKFDTIILRAGGNQSWTHHNNYRGDNRGRAQYVRDQFAKDLQGRMGSPYLHNAYAFVYINGLFWGLYNPTERATNGYGEAYLGGEEEDFDALNSGEILDGNTEGWDRLMTLVDLNLSHANNYGQVADLLDLECFTDYMLLNHWGGNEDWEGGNWYAMRNRLMGKFYFFSWDSEFIFETATADVTYKNTNNKPGEIFYSLLENDEYRILAADRIYKHFQNEGALTTDVALPIWEERSAQVYQALIAESARWGDHRRDVHRTAPPYELYTRDDQWLKERDRVLNSILPWRNRRTLSQYKRMGLVPETPAPDFSKERGALSGSDSLIISTTLSDSPPVYYTMDGSDPRLVGGEVSPTAMIYDLPISISERTTIKARIQGSASWSPLHESDFHPAGDPADLQISEILYEPLPSAEVEGKELEFVEIRNSGPASISLDGMEISGGIDFVFPAGLSVASGKHIVVVSNVAAFSAGNPGVAIAGEYTGSLSNTGDKITLKHETLGKIQQIVYSDWYPWPAEAATLGHSLVPVSLDYRGEPTQSIAWKAGAVPGGTPGTGERAGTGWIEHDSLGWVYSETGEAVPGSWVYSGTGYLYIGSEDPAGSWIWFMK